MYPDQCTKVEAAAAFGVGANTITKWIKERGCPARKKGQVYSLRLAEVHKWRLELERGGRGGEDMDPGYEQGRLARAKADSQEMVNALRQGELLEEEAVRGAWTAVAMAIRGGMLALPARLAPELVGLRSERAVRRRIDEEVRELLRELSDERPI